MRPSAPVLFLAVVLLAVACLHAVRAQDVQERIEKVPAKVVDMYGKTIEREITVTVFEVPGRAPYPLLVLNHGRAVTDEERVKFGRARSTEASHWFATRGYSVWVPTRIGYGVSGAEVDPEYSGTCHAKRYAPAYAAAADQTLQVIEHAKRTGQIDGRHIVVAGQSFGGMTSIAVAARNVPGVIAAINFAGGGGATPSLRRGEPCAAAQVGEVFGSYGQTSRIRTLWVYTENDRWFAPHHTKAWFESFRTKGGTGEYALLPPFDEDGHTLFSRGAAVWQPVVERFLTEVDGRARQ